MKYLNKSLSKAILASAIFILGCSDDKSASASPDEVVLDFSSSSTEIVSPKSSETAIEEKLGKCGTKNDGTVVKPDENDEHKYVCKDDAWKRISVADLGENLLWYHFGSCTDKEEGVIKPPSFMTFHKVISHICTNHSWEEPNRGMLPECNSDYLGEVIYLSEASTLICDEKREWRSATDIEAPKTQFFLFFANTDTLPGLCLKEKSGKIVQVDYDKYYICADSIWKVVTPAEYNFGKCEGVYLDSIVEISPSEKYVCQDTGWRQLDLIETGLGICTAQRQNEMGTSIWSVSLRPHVCDNEKWREATEAEKALGVCTEEKKGITDSIPNSTEFYTCDGKYWRFATDEEIFHTRLGECTKRSLKVTVTIDTVDYICDTDGWRTGNEMEQAIGFCTSLTENQIDTFEENMYICNGSEWIVFVTEE